MKDLQAAGHSGRVASAGASGHKPVREIKPGDRVWLANFETEATVLEIRDQSATVDMNGISFKTPVSSLYEAVEHVREAAPVSVSHAPAAPRARYELKLLGFTFDEAQPLIDEFLDDACLAGLHTLRIVHGKGTGALRSKVRDYLHRRKMVVSIETPPPNEGGSGVTLVKI